MDQRPVKTTPPRFPQRPEKGDIDCRHGPSIDALFSGRGGVRRAARWGLQLPSPFSFAAFALAKPATNRPPPTLKYVPKTSVAPLQRGATSSTSVDHGSMIAGTSRCCVGIITRVVHPRRHLSHRKRHHALTCPPLLTLTLLVGLKRHEYESTMPIGAPIEDVERMSRIPVYSCLQSVGRL